LIIYYGHNFILFLPTSGAKQTFKRYRSEDFGGGKNILHSPLVVLYKNSKN
jgi:hypothetical protein